MKKKWIFLFILVALCCTCIEDVSAETLEQAKLVSYVSFGNSGENANCSSNYCATSIYTYGIGIRVSIIDVNGKQIVPPKNFWPSSTLKYYVENPNSTSLIKNKTDGYNCKTHSSLKSSNKYENIYDATVGLPTGEGMSQYATYINSLTSSAGTTKVKNIIKNLISQSQSEFNYNNYYLKIEPIYIIKEKYGTNCNYFVGTSLEILNTFGSSTNGSYGLYFASGGNNNIINGPWNVIRNYIVAMYYSCDTKNGPNVECYNSDKHDKASANPTTFNLTNYIAYCDGGDCTAGKGTRHNYVPDLIEWYKTGNGHGLGVGYIKISIDDCQSRANANKGNVRELIKLYEEYKNKGKDYKNLLNFDNPSCTVKKKSECNFNSTASCFSGSVSINRSNNDFSCYNKTIAAISNSNSSINGYCVATLNITNLLNQNGFSGKSGQLLIKAEEFLNSEITLNCAFPGSIRTDTISKDNLEISEYLNIEINSDSEPETTDEQWEYVSNPVSIKNSGNLYTITLNSNGSFTPKYALIGSGEIYSNECLNCSFIGYGFITRLNASSGSGKINFEYNFLDNNANGTCLYNLNSEIIKNDKLNLAFRIIDTYKAFPGRDGNGRKIGSNWCASGYTNIINSGTDNLKYDFNDDGIVNEKDIYDGVCDSSKSDDNILMSYISDSLNSYGIVPSNNKTGSPKYTIELTSDEIIEIRKYNKEHSYDDFDFDCSSGTCRSNFLKKYITK